LEPEREPSWFSRNALWLLAPLGILVFFLVIFSKLRSSKRQNIKSPNQDEPDSIQAQNRGDDQGSLPSPIIAHLHIPEEEKTENRTYQKRNFCLQTLLTVGTWLAFGAAAYYAHVARQQLNATENFQRAILTVDFPKPNIQERDKQIYASGSFTVRNLSPTPALQPAIKWGYGGGIHFPDCKASSPRVTPNQASAPIGSPVVFNYDFLMGDKDKIESLQWYESIEINWAFFDVFGRTDYQTIFYVYDSDQRVQAFRRCSVSEVTK
jgi:hypothetical protein